MLQLVTKEDRKIWAHIYFTVTKILSDFGPNVSMILKSYILVSDPFPEPKSSLPISIMGSIYLVPRSMAPAAKVDDPSTHRKENKNTPTANKNMNTT